MTAESATTKMTFKKISKKSVDKILQDMIRCQSCVRQTRDAQNKQNIDK